MPIFVVDASLVVSALVDDGEEGRWAERMLGADHLAAPHLMPVEAANILRRASLAGSISSDVAAMAHGDLLNLRIDLFPYAPLADRAWELRQNVKSYDAWYVAVAEHLDAPLATLDVKLAQAAGPWCAFVTPSARFQ